MSEIVNAPLPDPDSPELIQLLPRESLRALYRFLHQHRDDPPTTHDIHAFMAHDLGASQSEAIRRVRELRGHFQVKTLREGNKHRYLLIGRNQTDKGGVRKSLSAKIKAQVLAPQRCAQCGRTPLDHQIVLVVDHKIPRDWGGTDNVENLQPLCEECNSGKKAFYATYNEYASEIHTAANYDEPHRRIGELLKAFNGNWVPSELISIVASMRQYQEDWQKRLRELRVLGWVIKNRVTKDPATGRSASWYRVVDWEPWPDGSIRSEISRREGRRKGGH
ncbi:HNH endonuclease [Streptomyces sp. 7N604]|uniref:HNH endonuclease n=1 Tax=Streptomyces sp. 7N604 TaxID=3457415 RepID=UPI003FD2D344